MPLGVSGGRRGGGGEDGKGVTAAASCGVGLRSAGRCFTGPGKMEL